MNNKQIYDIIGIGIGPFNLGLAALTDAIPELKCLFIDQNKEFNWHPGLMLDNARLQVPFYADLVTLADPCSKYSYLAFLKARQRMFRFAILENNFILRKEYNEYCRWVAGQLTSLEFGFRCETIKYDGENKAYCVHVRNESSNLQTAFYCKHIVIGVGTVPYVPDLTPNPSPKGEGLLSVAGDDFTGPLVFHSSDYLYFKEQVLTKKNVAIIGSGQSAAEIFYDLLTSPRPSPPSGEGGDSKFSNGLNWFTRSDEFFPMDYSSFALEKTSPDYINHFFRLSLTKKKETLQKQNHLYKGINLSLIQEIYCELYLQSLTQGNATTGLYPNSKLQSIAKATDDKFELSFYHSENEQSFCHKTEAVILATGYKQQRLDFIEAIKERIQWTDDPSTSSGQVQYQVNRNYSIDKDESIFVQNAELHTHGFNAPDLGMGPNRNAVILNSILNREYFTLERNICFQTFGFPQ